MNEASNKEIMSEALFNQLRQRPRLKFTQLLALSSSAAILICSGLIYIVIELVPFFNKDLTKDEAIKSVGIDDAWDRLRSAQMPLDEVRSAYIHVPASSLVTVVVTMSRSGQNQLIHTTTELRLRWDRLILVIGAILITVTIFATVRNNIQSERPIIGGADAQGGAAMHSRTSLELFSADVAATGLRAEALFSRSTLLLIGGIIMSFIGVAIFYVTLPETKGDEQLSSYWPKVVRPTGVLIFLEAIAWFLLRQYRSLVEDYKWFYRLYLKRSNYLIACRLLSRDNIRPEDMFIATSLLQEDHSGRLRPGETTEAIESLKLPEESPISDIIRAISAYKESQNRKS